MGQIDEHFVLIMYRKLFKTTFNNLRLDDIEDNSDLRRGIPGERFVFK